MLLVPVDGVGRGLRTGSRPALIGVDRHGLNVMGLTDLNAD